MKLKKKELRLLYELDTNYRNSYANIGKKIRLSQQLISHKVEVYRKKKIIERYFPLIDYSRLGLLSFIVLFKVRYRSEESYAKLIAKLKNDSGITGIEECDGKFDLLTSFAAPNPSYFNKKVKKLISENPELREWVVLTKVVEHHYPRDHLRNKEGSQDIIIGGDREEAIIEKANLKMLQALQDEKKKLVDLAHEANITQKTAAAHLRWLEKNEIVRAYRLILGHHKIGISANIILIKFGRINTDQEEKFTYFCKKNPNIIELTKTFGEWDAVVHVETKNRAEFRNLSLQIKEIFDEIIDDMDSFRVFAVHLKKSIPTEFFEESSQKPKKK